MNLKINFVEAEEGEEGQVVRDNKKKEKKERKMSEKKIDQVNALPRKLQGEKVRFSSCRCIYEKL